MLGERLLHYEITEKLGEGGMGVVYKARDTHLDRFVAIKVLSPGHIFDASRKARFVQEAKAASALNHPNIVVVHDIASYGGTDFIVLEYVGGTTLNQLIPRNGMRLGEALKIAIQVADALSRAHAARIVHRDLKPSNIMVNEHALAKVLDFGLVKLIEPDTSEDAATATMGVQTEETAIMGTAAYMSPEQAEGKAVDARTDVFSFGAVLYEMISGRRAFPGDSQMSTLSAILREEPRELEDVPHDLRKLIARCLRKDAGRRYQHMDDVRIALEELKEESDSGKLTPAGARTRRSWPAVLAAGCFIVLLAAAGAWFLGQRAGREVIPAAPVPLTSYPGEEVQPSFSPDGNQVAFVWNGEQQDNPDIYVKLIGGSEKPLRLTTDPAPDLSPAWSPDGRFIAFVRDGGVRSLLLVPAIGGPERLVTDLGAPLGAPGSVTAGFLREAPFPLLAWGTGSKSLIVADRSTRWEPLGLYVVSIETGEKRQLTSPRAGILGDGAPAVSPDGRNLLFSRALNGNASDLYRLPLTVDLRAAGEPEQLTSSIVWNASPSWLAGGGDFVFAKGGTFAGPFSLWRMDVSAAGRPRRLSAAGEQSAWPAVSAKGDRLVFSRAVRDTNIWRVPLHDAIAGVPERFISSTRGDEVPQYSPGGDRIVFTSDRSGTVEVWVCDRDGSNPVQLTSLGAARTGSPHWSPDGKQIVFDSNASGQFEVYGVRAAGGGLRRLTNHPATDALASFSHDGRQIYYSSTRTGSYQVWKMAAEGGEAIQVTLGGGQNPIVSTDGTLIFYRKAGQLWSVPVTGGEEVKVLDSVAFMSYTVTEGGIYFIQMCGGAVCPSIQFFDLASRSVTPVLSTVESFGVGLCVSPNRKFLLYTQKDQSGSDLMLIENFR